MTAKPETAAEVLAEMFKQAESGASITPLQVAKWASRLERALSAQGEAVASPLDLSAPPKVWLQVDPNGDAEDHSEAIPRTAWDDLTWCYESVGGQEVEYVRADLAHPAPAQAAHPDDIAVDRFAAAMKDKLAAARAKGRGGWDDKEDLECHLSNLLRAHVEKGDPRDVANFCCFLWNRGESIQPAPARVTEEVRALLERALPFLRDEAGKYDDDGSNEPLELTREIEAALEDGRHG